MLVEYYEWYGASVSCLRCGDQWNDGELSMRPLARGWRKRNIAEFEKRLTSLALDAATAARFQSSSTAEVYNPAKGQVATSRASKANR